MASVNKASEEGKRIEGHMDMLFLTGAKSPYYASVSRMLGKENIDKAGEAFKEPEDMKSLYEFIYIYGGSVKAYSELKDIISTSKGPSEAVKKVRDRLEKLEEAGVTAEKVMKERGDSYGLEVLGRVGPAKQQVPEAKRLSDDALADINKSLAEDISKDIEKKAAESMKKGIQESADRAIAGNLGKAAEYAKAEAEKSVADAGKGQATAVSTAGLTPAGRLMSRTDIQDITNKGGYGVTIRRDNKGAALINLDTVTGEKSRDGRMLEIDNVRNKDGGQCAIKKVFVSNDNKKNSKDITFLFDNNEIIRVNVSFSKKDTVVSLVRESNSNDSKVAEFHVEKSGNIKPISNPLENREFGAYVAVINGTDSKTLGKLVELKLTDSKVAQNPYRSIRNKDM